MTKRDKSLNRLLSRPVDFTWDEAVTLLQRFGYQKESGAGSRYKFRHVATQQLINLHAPHPGTIIKRYMIDIIINALKQGDHLS